MTLFWLVWGFWTAHSDDPDASPCAVPETRASALRTRDSFLPAMTLSLDFLLLMMNDDDDGGVDRSPAPPTRQTTSVSLTCLPLSFLRPTLQALPRAIHHLYKPFCSGRMLGDRHVVQSGTEELWHGKKVNYKPPHLHPSHHHACCRTALHIHAHSPHLPWLELRNIEC